MQAERGHAVTCSAASAVTEVTTKSLRTSYSKLLLLDR
jgi:hypothetical protein